MKILVIGDIHGRKFWRETIHNNLHRVDKVIFLGDYLDPYNDEIHDNYLTKSMECERFEDSQNLLKMLNDIVSLKKNEPNKYILLTGNHTDSYIWSKFKAATRTDHKNWELYHKFFSQNLEFFNLVWVEDNVIFSHAGISDGWAREVWKKFRYPESAYKSIMDVALALHDIPLTNVNDEYIQLISDISYYRWGYSDYGSCEWADIKEHVNMSNTKVFDPIGEDEIYQVFGHTQLKGPLITKKWACLDCRKGFIIDTLTWEITEEKDFYES